MILQILNKHLLSCIIIILCCWQFAYSQSDTLWTRTFGGQKMDEGNCVQQTRDNGFIIVGSTRSFGNGLSDIWLLKTDASGNEIWSHTYGGTNFDTGRYVRQTADNGYIIIGSKSSDNGRFDIWLIKTNEFGDTLWTKKFGNNDTIDEGFRVLQTKDNGYVLAGLIEEYGWPQIWFAKTDSLGELDWSKTIEVQFVMSTFCSIQQTTDGGYIILASSGNPEGIYLIKTDDSGNLIWQKWYYGYHGHPLGAYGVQQTSDDGYILTGSVGGDLWLAKADALGDSTWTKRYARYGIDEGRSVLQTTDGGYIITGISYNDLWLLRTNSIGDTIWTKLYGGNQVDEGNFIQQTTDGGYIITGSTRSYGNGESDIWLLKMAVGPTAVIHADSVWLDSDWDGFARNSLDGTGSYNSEGYSITTYKWIVDKTVVGTEPHAEINLPTGTHHVRLEVTDELGMINYSEFPVHVCSYRLETKGTISSAVSTIGDSLFFSTSTDDKIYCFQNSGEVNWFLMTGGDIQSTTTIGPNNHIYVGSNDTRLYAFDINGNFLWDRPMGGIVTASPAITPDGNMYVGTTNHRLYSVNSTNGNIYWNYLTGGPISSSASISKAGTIYFGSDDGRLYALKESGELNWDYQTEAAVKSSPAIDTFGSVYFGSNDGSLYALSDAGALKWKFETGGAIISSPVIDMNGNIYVGSDDGFFYAIRQNGDMLWSYHVGVPVYGTAAISSNDNIYFGCQDGRLIALSLTGELKWYYQTAGAIQSSPLLTETGRLYVGSNDSILYGFRYPEPDLDKIGDSETHQWPTFQKDNQRTGYQSDIETDIHTFNDKTITIKYNLTQNFPNPFNPTTTIHYQLAMNSEVKLSIYNTNGQLVRTLVNEYQPAGLKSIVWNGLDTKGQKVSSGIYVYQVEVGDYIDSKKMIMMK
ncbi:PQQ-binding-like beta-propeller repeat protein [candidate division KSB1 bacterium]|nr:PQQ-binding-like beta-propeller repeat protein [candidate division KSB1 bacterium]